MLEVQAVLHYFICSARLYVKQALDLAGILAAWQYLQQFWNSLYKYVPLLGKFSF
jgi:hypothetical protein